MLVRIPLLVGLVLLTSILLDAQPLPSARAMPLTNADTAISSVSPPPSLPTIVRRVDEVSLLLSVTNRRGRFVQDLSESDLIISDNGEAPDKITSFQRQTDLPLRVALVLDTSDSVRYRLAFEQKSAHAFLQGILRPESDLAMIVSFNEKPTLIQPFTNDLSQLGAAIQSLTIDGGTSVYDAVAFAADELAARADLETARRVIVLVTDGEENRSYFNLTQAVEHALRAECVIYVVNTNALALTPLVREADRNMRYLADATGGSILSGGSDREIAKSFQKIQQELRSQYALSYRPHGRMSGLLFRTIRILGPRNIRLRYRAGYYVR